jgi:streptogramin lyase/mono/diheme cytochrome c family protein
MKFKALLLLFLVEALLFVAHGQQSSSPLTERQQTGRRIFEQRCAVCHTRPTLTSKNPYGPALSRDLVLAFGDSARTIVLKGLPGMPAFQYGLDSSDVDAIFDYLKTGPMFVVPDGQTEELHNNTGKAIVDEKPRETFFLTGTIKSEGGEKLEGIVVSAKAEGQTVTTSVFTDKSGNYYFPALPAGRYHTWAQAQTYQTAKSDVDLTKTQRDDFVLRPLKDFFRQLSGDQLLSALPESTPTEKRLKLEFQHDCLGCHESSFVLQNRFDEAGWTAVIDVMKHETGIGSTGDIDQAPLPLVQYQEKELAAYLAKMRGPGVSPMKPQPQARPTGEAARALFTEYDVPVDWSWDKDVMGGVLTNNGSDWSLGNPSALNGGRGVHDAQADREGNIWFSYNGVSIDRTIGRIDANNGALTNFGLKGAPKLSAMGHAIALDHNGILWFNVNPRGPDYQGPERLASVNPKTFKVNEYVPPTGIDPPGGAVTMAVDPKGFLWVSSRFGVLRFNTTTHEFNEYRSTTKIFEGIGTSYGVAGDRDGNGWWAQFYSGLDTVEKADVATGQTLDVKLTPVPGIKELFSPEDLKMYQLAGSDQEAAYPWLQGPRRLGADPNGDVVWVGCYWSGFLAKIDTHTLKFDFIAAPNPNLASYSAVVDNDHNVWVTFMNGDQVGKYDPKTAAWTMFRLPSMGTDVRWVSLHQDTDGTLQVILPYFTSSRIARMSVRSEADLKALQDKTRQLLQAQ